MQNSPRVFFERTVPGSLAQRISRVLPEDVVVAFHIEGADGGSWDVVRGEGLAAHVRQGADGPKDCELRISADDFERILRGELDPREAFFAGRLVVTGDIGLALRIQTVLGSAA